MAYTPSKPTGLPGVNQGSGKGPSYGQSVNAAGDSVATLAMRLAAEQIPYVYGGTSTSGFDCSGLVQYLWKQAGVSLPRTSEQQWTAGTQITQNQLQPGDLVFSQWPGDDAAPGHVAVYVGGGNIVEAPHTGEDVHQIPLDSSYLSHVTGFRHPTTGGESFTVPGGPVSQSGGGLLQFPQQITDFFSSTTDDLTKTAAFFSAFFQPATYVRIGAGVGGLVAVVAGVVFLILAAGDTT